MKKLINILLSAAVLVTVSSCADELPLDTILADTEFGIALRSIDEDNGLDLSDLNSVYRHQFEIDAVKGGLEPDMIRILVGFTDDDAKEETDTEPEDPANSMDPIEFGTMDPASFNEETDITTHGLPVGTFTANLSELLSFLNLNAGDYDRGDAIEFEFELIATDGTVFNKDNVGTNVAAAGRFSFYNSPFAWTAEIDDPNRIVLDDTSLAPFSNSSLRVGKRDTVLLTFDGEVFVTNPTITSSLSTGDDTIGPLTKVEFADEDEDGTDDNENVFFFFYTAGSALGEKVSFTVSGGESVSDFPMETVVFEDAFTVDNVDPVISVGGAGSKLSDDGTEFKNISVEVFFSEEIDGGVTYTITSAQFDIMTFTQEVEAEEFASIEFKPAVGGVALPAGTVTFTVSAAGLTNEEGTDAAGNAITGLFAVNIF